MFDTYEFIFNGESSQSYGLYICDIAGKSQSDVSFGNKASIIEARTVGRITPLHFGVNYNTTPLQFKLVFGRDKPIDRFEFERIAFWLTGHQDYKWLQIVQTDLLHVCYRCLITDLTPISYGWTPYAFEATITCDSPYAYGREEVITKEVNGETALSVLNMSSVRDPIMPKIVYTTLPSASSFSIINTSDNNREMSLSFPAGEHIIEIDCRNGIIRENGSVYNFYQGFNMNFLKLLNGKNDLVITGDGSISLKFRTLHNISA